MKMFSRNCSNAAYEYFKVHMPTGKVWKKKPDSGIQQKYILFEFIFNFNHRNKNALPLYTIILH